MKYIKKIKKYQNNNTTISEGLMEDWLLCQIFTPHKNIVKTVKTNKNVTYNVNLCPFNSYYQRFESQFFIYIFLSDVWLTDWCRWTSKHGHGIRKYKHTQNPRTRYKPHDDWSKHHQVCGTMNLIGSQVLLQLLWSVWTKTTPKILELDRSCMMIGQNTIRFVVQWIWFVHKSCSNCFDQFELKPLPKS